MTLRDELAAASRERVLRCLARAIHGYTVLARDPEASDVRKADINNRIHYLAGHLMALVSVAEPLTDSRLDGIMEHVDSLHPRLTANIRAELTR